jgi:exodeoxyribonuclease VII large subunit
MFPPADSYHPLEVSPILRVSQALSLCNGLLSELTLQIEGEVSGYSLSRGKFVFFDLKDEQEDSRLSCFMMAFNSSIPLEDGMRVVIEGKPGLYQKSGQFRITVQRVTPKGEGSLKRAFELLKAKLQSEGLFDQSRKRALPRFPRSVGIISSAEAAGYGDFIKIANSRLGGVEFLLANVAVQGKDAESEICRAFDVLNERPDLEVIVLIRGGGSLEDLHAFNSESVARAIIRSRLPVLVGVGHERDVTIADFCADVRASTPSNAAQILLPSKEEVTQQIIGLVQAGRRILASKVSAEQVRTKSMIERMGRQLSFGVSVRIASVKALLKTIDALSPQRSLERGFTITCLDDGTPLRSCESINEGVGLTTRLADGTIHSITTTK